VHKPVVLFVALGTLVATIALAVLMPKGFFPTEDIGQISVNAEAVEDISFPAMTDLLQKVGNRIRENPAVDTVVMGADSTNNGRLFINLKPRSERPTLDKVLEGLRRDMRSIPGVNVYFNPIQNLRLGGRVSKSRFQYVTKGVNSAQLQENADKMVGLMRADPIFRDVTSDSQMKGLQAQLSIDRDKANGLGVNIQDIRTALYTTFGERQVSTIFTAVDSYQVILQGRDEDRADESAFAKVYVRGKGGALVPLTSVASVERKVGPLSINHAGSCRRSRSLSISRRGARSARRPRRSTASASRSRPRRRSSPGGAATRPPSRPRRAARSGSS
jgi:HAE1 family hydrophobic/amphiphilic exporter-1